MNWNSEAKSEEAVSRRRGQHMQSTLRLGKCGMLRCRPICIERAMRWGSMALENRAGLGGEHAPVHCRHKVELLKGLKQRRGISGFNFLFTVAPYWWLGMDEVTLMVGNCKYPSGGRH